MLLVPWTRTICAPRMVLKGFFVHHGKMALLLTNLRQGWVIQGNFSDDGSHKGRGNRNGWVYLTFVMYVSLSLLLSALSNIDTRAIVRFLYIVRRSLFLWRNTNTSLLPSLLILKHALLLSCLWRHCACTLYMLSNRLYGTFKNWSGVAKRFIHCVTDCVWYCFLCIYFS